VGLYRRNNRFWWISYTVAGRQVFESSHSLNKRVAKRLLAVRQAEIAEGRFRFVKSNPPRLEEWAAEFLDSIPHANTKRRYASSIANLLAFFRTARVSQITPDRVEAFKKARLKARVKSATVNRDLAVLRRMLKLAARQRLIAQSPFEEVEFLEERKHRRQPHILTFEEQERVLAVAPPRLRVLIVLLTETGLRVNKEALSLKWTDVELVNSVIHVRQSKTPAGVRSVPLSELCKAELQRWRSLTGPEFSEHVFPNLENTRHPLQGGRRSWVSALRKAGIEYFPVYNLRHTFASRLAAAGASPLTVAQMLGHASAGIVMTYAKAIDEVRRDAIRKLEALRESRLNLPTREAESSRDRPN
jgi:integrase